VNQHDAGDGDADKPWQGRRDNSTPRDSSDVPGMVVSGVYVRTRAELSSNAA